MYGGGVKARLLADLASRDNVFVTMLTETHIDSDVLDSEILSCISDFTIFRGDRDGRNCGGVAILAHENLSGEIIESFDNQAVQFVVERLHALNTVFCCLYRPPDTKFKEFDEALSELNRIISDFPSPMPTLVFGGDLNFPQTAIQWECVDHSLVPYVGVNRGERDGEGPKVRAQASKMLELMEYHNMAQYVNEVTHGKEILDILFTNDPDLIHSLCTESFPSFTDHELVNIRVNYKLFNTTPMKREFLLDSARRMSLLDFNKAPWGDIRQELRNIDWSDLKRLSIKSPVVGHSFFVSKILGILEHFVPRKENRCSGRNKKTRCRNLLWRKLSKIKTQIKKSRIGIKAKCK